MIEFGGLDDSPSGIAPHCGQDRGGRRDKSGRAADAAGAHLQPTLVAETTEDPETFEQLRHIQKLLADVQAEFQPVAAIEPEVELVFETPHPFAEPFEEEEVIADRYAAVVPPPAPRLPAVEPAQTVAAVAVAAAANEAEPESPNEAARNCRPASRMSAPSTRSSSRRSWKGRT